jgi:hypothetical protein
MAAAAATGAANCEEQASALLWLAVPLEGILHATPVHLVMS